MKKLLFLCFLLHLQPAIADWHTIFAHGIIDGPSQMDRFTEAICTPASAVEFTDAQQVTDWSINRCIASACTAFLGIQVNRCNMYMGQGDDIARLHKKLTGNQHDQIILYGCSRGAATIINTLAQQNTPNIAALVLDATPADMPATIIQFWQNLVFILAMLQPFFKCCFLHIQKIVNHQFRP